VVYGYNAVCQRGDENKTGKLREKISRCPCFSGTSYPGRHSLTYPGHAKLGSELLVAAPGYQASPSSLPCGHRCPEPHPSALSGGSWPAYPSFAFLSGSHCPHLRRLQRVCIRLDEERLYKLIGYCCEPPCFRTIPSFQRGEGAVAILSAIEK